MRLYFKFRPFLFAVALGLACVWFYKGIMLGKDYVHVDLPQTETGDVLSVFGIEQRFMPFGGGSHFCSGLYLDESSNSPNSDRLSFTVFQCPGFSRYDDRPPEFINVRHRADDSLEIAPYFFECSRPGSKPVRFVPDQTDFSEFQVQSITLTRDIEFTGEKPNWKGACQLYVGVAKDPSRAKELLEQASFQSKDGKLLSDIIADGRRERFINE